MATLGAEANGRLIGIDVVRGLAIVGVVLFHFVWDLDLYGYVPAGWATHAVWIAFGRTLAATFMVLVGVGLVLAHRDGFRARPFARRVLVIALAAMAVSVTTFFAFPDVFVTFGILHSIAIASLLGVLLLRVSAASLAQLGVFVVLVGLMGSFDAFNPRWLAWIGLSSVTPSSLDFVPVFPWFGATLLGMAAAKGGVANALERALSTVRETPPIRGLCVTGRHSLVIYLLHQPVLLGSIELMRQLS